MNKNIFNYLYTLPNKYQFRTLKSNNLLLISNIITSNDNTNDYILLDFRYKLIYILVKKLIDSNNNFNIENYFTLKNNLIILDELLIKSSSNELITLLNESDDKLNNYITNLNKAKNFSCSYERKEIIENNKKIYKIVPKKIIPEDIFIYIDEITKDIKKDLIKILNYLIDNDNYINSLKKIEKDLIIDTDFKQEIYNYLINQVSYLNNDSLTIIKQIINNYINNYLFILEILINERRKEKRIRNANDHIRKEKEFDFLVNTKKYKCRK